MSPSLAAARPGLAAAVAAYQENPNLSIVVLERDRELGGILNQCIHNGFGLHHFGEELTGPEYAQRFVEQVRATRVDCWTDAMVLSLSPEREICGRFARAWIGASPGKSRGAGHGLP